MENKIDLFKGENYFLSNFYRVHVRFDGVLYTSSEAAFQAQKCIDPAEKFQFIGLGPKDAKYFGKFVKLRNDWEQVKLEVMEEVVRAKFEQNPDLAQRLLATGTAYLEEGNWWGDRYWGTVDGVGENHLGIILMKVRDYIKTINS